MKNDLWLDYTLEDIILEYRGCEDCDSLTAKKVNRLAEILRAKINLHEGLLNLKEYDEIVNKH